MRVSKIPFGPDFKVPKARIILNKWSNIVTVNVGNGLAGGIPEYHTWLREDHGKIDPSPEVEPIQLPGQKDTFGIGYEPTSKEISSSSLKRKGDILFPKTITLLSPSFANGSIAQYRRKLLKKISWKDSKTYSVLRKKPNAM
ncbi:hypothetical protein HAX54_009450 [Datura stramonium]|uniref:Uncharacterized protein n=1 Tax=Datura stramonium TaxID=4076 RepID=A0ABS8TG47_DATST|nr:hypothetical protein [Datura stramonium]